MARFMSGGLGGVLSRDELDDLLGSLVVQGRVIYALVLRESRTRYGTSDLGYLWALIDPMIQLTVLLLLFEALGRNVPIPVPLPVFLLTGIMPFHFFKDCVSRGAKAASSNSALLTYPQVKVVDVVLARVLLEAATASVVYVLFIVALKFMLGIAFSDWVDELPKMMAALGAIFFFGLSFALFSSSLTRVTPLWESIWGYMSRPLWMLSGVFFSLSAIPAHGKRHFMIYNPVAHLLEWWRSSSLPQFESSIYSPEFVLISAVVVFVIGLLADRILAVIGHTDTTG